MKDYQPAYPNPDDDHRPEWEKKLRPLFSAAEDVDGEGARPSSLIPVHRPKVIDPLHELNLLRMMQVANERTVRELGPLPPGGLPPVQKKRKPTAPYTDFLGRVVPEVPSIIEENDEMKLSQLAGAAALTVGVMAGCGDPKNPTHNPHPKQRYEITLTIEGAPGPFESVTASAGYEITNAADCAPQDWISGVHPVPGYSVPITLIRVNDYVYKGAFHLDLVQDGNYYGKGRCHWVFSGLGIDMKSHDVSFGTGMVLGEVIARKTVTEYAPKRLYFGSKIPNMNVGGQSMSDSISAHRDDYFSMTITVKEDAHEQSN